MLKRYSHPLYKHVSEEAADAVAWAWVTKDKIEKFPFKFYPLRPEEVRANVLYCGLCHSDVLMSRSQWFKNLTYPIVAGHEIVAEISEVGTEVKNLKKGDKVGFGFLRDSCGRCKYCLRQKENLCIDTDTIKPVFGHYFGGFATQIQQPADFCFKLPDNIDYKRAGPLLCAGITVYAPINNWIKKEDKTAVIGIGGLGHMAVQFLSKMGHNVTAFNNHLDYKDLIEKLGANEVVNVSDKTNLKKYSGKFDFIINTVPYGGSVGDLIDLCSPQGRFIQVGLPDEDDPLKVPHIPLVFKEIQIIGSIVGTRDDNKKMLDFASKKNVYPMVEEFSFEDFPKAVEKIEKGKPKFRIVINVEDFSRKNNLFRH
jgi:uncharacterized zinc-type alcohol dehydrogenase-like protein